MGKKCIYHRDSPIEQYTPECCVDGDGEPTDSVHSHDAADWYYCPYCGRKIKEVTG